MDVYIWVIRQAHLKSLDSCFLQRQMCCWLYFYRTNSHYSFEDAADGTASPWDKWFRWSHTTKTLVCVCVCESTCRGDDLPSDMTAKTARLRREKHVILIMNVNSFTACFRWGDGNWGIMVRLNRNGFSSLMLAEFKMEMRGSTQAKL